MTHSRRLVAIMFTDIAGYTRLMNSNEEKALNLLSENRRVHQSRIEEYGGRYIKEMGDGTLSTFASTSDAVNCAIAIQKDCLFAGIPIRIGINQGEVTFQNGDVFGDSVNAASHIESIGTANSILISEASNNQLKNKAGFKTKYIGSFHLKNIERPVGIYALQGEGLVVPTRTDLKKGNVGQTASRWKAYVLGIGFTLALIIASLYLINSTKSKQEISEPDRLQQSNYIDKNSIVVLPFRNLSGNADQDYFVEGMMEEIMNKLFQINNLNVISRTTSMKYKDSELSASEIADELKVANALEGSVRISGQKVRIAIKLIDGKTDVQKWLHTYDSELDDIFGVQSDIAKQVAANLKLGLNPEVTTRIETSSTSDPDVWKLYMRSRHIAAYTNDIERAIDLLKEAVALDPDFAPAYAELGYQWLWRGTFEGDLEGEELLDSAYHYLNIAKNIDPDFPTTHVYLAALNLWFKWDFKSAEEEWNTFYRLNPSNQSNDPSYLDFLNASRRFDESLQVSNRMLANDASASASWSTSGLSFYFSGLEEKAVNHYDEAIEIFPISSVISDAGRTYIYTANYDKAIELLKESFKHPEKSTPRNLGNLAMAYFHTGEQQKANYLLGYLKERSTISSAGSPAYYAAQVLAQMGQKDLAFEYLKKAFETREVEMYWLDVEPPFDPLRGDERWNILLQKVGFKPSNDN